MRMANMNGFKWFMSATTIIILATVLIGFWYLQGEINDLRPESENSPTTALTPSSQPNSKATAPTEQNSFSYVVYEWHLRPKYINDVTWLNQTLSEKSGIFYDSDKTWNENYITCIDSFYAYPQQLMNAHLEGPVSAAFIRRVFGNASFNEATGFTKATYQYAEYDHAPMYYLIESVLPTVADSRGWTKTFT